MRGSDKGSRGSSPIIASSSSATSSTLRAIGPCWPRFMSTAPSGVCATRPTLGRKPTMPLKLAGLRKRAAHVGAVREPRRAGRERDRGAAGRARGRARRVPRIARRAEHLVEGVGAGAEFRRVRHRVDDAAFGLEMLHQNVGLLRDVILEDRRALRRAHARDRDFRSLIGIGMPASCAALGDRLLHQPVGMLARPVEAQRRQRVHRRRRPPRCASPAHRAGRAASPHRASGGPRGSRHRRGSVRRSLDFPQGFQGVQAASSVLAVRPGRRPWADRMGEMLYVLPAPSRPDSSTGNDPMKMSETRDAGERSARSRG